MITRVQQHNIFSNERNTYRATDAACPPVFSKLYLQPDDRCTNAGPTNLGGNQDLIYMCLKKKSNWHLFPK